MTTSMWYVYIVRCSDNSLYTGIARDVAARLAQHNSGQGAKYTRGRGPVELLHQEQVPDRAAALRREAQIKRMTPAGKHLLVAAARGKRL